jgi:hypothetical protein
VPSLKALRALGEGAFLRPPSSFRHGRPQTFREVLQWVAGTGLGAALAPLAAAIGFGTGKRPVHANGAAYDGVLEIPTPADELLDGTVLDRPGRYPVKVRLSRGFNRRLSRTDVHGVAIRIVDAGGTGRHQDLLLATSKPNASGMESTSFSLGYEPRFTSTLHLGSPQGPVLVVARPIGAVPDDALVHGGAAGAMQLALGVQVKGLEERQVGVVTLGAALDAEETAALHFTIEHDWGGIQPWGVLNDARVVVYRAAAWGRTVRKGRG